MGFSFSIDLASFLYSKMNPPKQRKDLDSLSMSVLIPAYNEGANLERVVDAQYHQTKRPKNVIVINDNSTDNTIEVCKSIEKHYPNFLCITNPVNKGKGEGINTVIREHYNDLGDVAYINDGDVLPDSQCLEELAKGFYDDNVAAVTGLPQLIAGGSLASRILTYGKQWQITVGRWRKKGQTARNGMFVLCGAIMAIRKNILKKMPMPARTMTEDLDYTWLLQEKGFKLGFQEKAKAKTYDVTDLKHHWAQTRRWHKGAWQAMYSHGKNLNKAKGLLYTTLIPSWMEFGLYAARAASLPFLLAYSPALLAGLLGFEAAVDVGVTIASKPSHIKYLPASFAYSAVSLASYITSALEVTFQKLAHQENKWGNKWSKKVESKKCQN